MIQLLLVVWVFFLLPPWSEAMEGHWQAPAKEANRKNPVPVDRGSLERGRKVYQAHCASCHGVKGKGDGPAGKGLTPPPADLTHMAGHHKDGDLAWKIAVGRGAMPGWKAMLTEDQIWDVVNFMKKGL